MIIGQEKICQRIDNATIDSFPRSLMLVGPRGSGKHLLVDYVATRFGLKVVTMLTSAEKSITNLTTETIVLEQESIEELYNRVEPYIYVISANQLTVKEENTILKFLEEPSKNSYIILLAETDNGLLQTILNRCQIWYLQNYKKEFLKTFLTSNEYILQIATTPGQVIELNNTPFEDMLQLADKIINKINIASVSNTLTLTDKLAFKGESNKFDVKLFVNILLQRFVEHCKVNTDTRLVNGYLLTSALQKKLNVKNLDYKALFDGYLIQLREIMQQGG